MTTSERSPTETNGTLGTFGGVFTPSILTILGLVLFLRVAYVVGSVGLTQTLAILALSTLGFVGVGLRPPTPELGLMVTEAFPYYHEAPWMSLAPVLALTTLLIGLLSLRRKETSP